MYESEVYHKFLDESLPNEVHNAFENLSDDLSHKSMLHWTEHCTECAIPHCYTTCDLYSPRFDGKCQRFLNGIETVKIRGSYILKINFKQWGVLSTQGNAKIFPVDKANKLESRDQQISNFIHLPWPNPIKKKLAQKRYSIKKHGIIDHQQEMPFLPDAFVTELYNSSQETVIMDLTFRNEDEKYRKMPFQYKIEVAPGYNREVIPFDEIDKRIKLDMKFRVDLTPSDISAETSLYFGILEFVKFKDGRSPLKQKAKGKKLKCVVWDLDNTIWNGVLTEKGKEGLVLRDGIKEMLNFIEENGVLQSIASKNDHDYAIEALEYFGLKDYFLFPKISWGPKSIAIKAIAKDFNIGSDSLLFVDDSEFERTEVAASLPEVMVIDAVEFETIPNMEAFQGKSTEEAKKRKELYVHEQQRKSVSEDFDGEYFDFLRSCEIKLSLLELVPKHHDRVYELTQRTNQMNFSGNIYEKEDIQKIADDNSLDKYVMRCSDKFGDYGIVGFAIINKAEQKLIDLMFSCRIQSKRVEHAFITHCLKMYLPNGDFLVRYKQTERNKFSAQVFNDFGFELIDQDGEIKNLKFGKDRQIPDDQLISLEV